MPKTDSPLKQLVRAFVTDIASWVLGQEVIAALPRPSELLPGQEPLRADQVWQLTLADGRTAGLHVEFQGPGTHRPMPLRMVEYITRMAVDDPDSVIYHVVLYVGRGVGKDDPGIHQIMLPDGQPVLLWAYQIIRVWEMDAEALLATGRPAVLALVGQARMAHPEVVLPQVVALLKGVPDPAQQQFLFQVLLTLMTDEEGLKMLDTLLATDDLGLDTALGRIRRREREEGREEGRVEGVRTTLLDAVQVRFRPSDATLTAVATVVGQVQDETTLRTLFHAALQAPDLAAWLAVLEPVQTALPPAPAALGDPPPAR